MIARISRCSHHVPRATKPVNRKMNPASQLFVTHHVMPSGHVIPFCAYNVLYRDGHVPLPKLVEAGAGARVRGRGGDALSPSLPLAPSPTLVP